MADLRVRGREKKNLVAIRLQEVDGQRLLALHQEGEGVSARRKVGFICKKFIDVVGNVAHETIAVEFVDGVTTRKV